MQTQLLAYPRDLIERVVAYLDKGPHRDVRPLIEGLSTQGRPVALPGAEGAEAPAARPPRPPRKPKTP